MFSFYKKYLIIAVLVHLSIALVSGSAIGTIITLDGRDDAGIKPGQSAFAEFIIAGNPSVEVLPSYGNEWLSSTDVFNYADSHAIYSWNRIQSAGNIWSSDSVVGDSLSISSAGTYRISPFSGTYMYDAFGWGGYANKYWWKVYIEADQVYVNGNLEQAQGYILGRDGVSLLDLTTLNASDSAYDSYALNSGNYYLDSYNSAPAAFAAVQNLSIDISLAQGGALKFWIWDWNSIDNSGAISLDVENVPEPSTFMLLVIGLAFLVRRIRSVSKNSR